MKKSTLFVLVLALGLGGFVYWYEFKRTPPKEESKDESKPAFSIDAKDLKAIELDRSGMKISIERRGDTWMVTQPVETKADSSAIEGIASGLAFARVSRTLPATSDLLASSGLNSPRVTIAFELQNGKKHSVKLGELDFSGQSAYALVDDEKNVAMLTGSLLTQADKPLDGLRDMSVLDVSSSEMKSVVLKTHSGEWAASKADSGWMLEKPISAPADDSKMNELLAQLSRQRMKSVESETPANLGKYGLEHPPITLEVKTAKGEAHLLEIGKKVDDDYYARDAARPMIFRVGDDLVKSLDVKFSDFRDKSLMRMDAGDLSRIELHNANGTFVISQGQTGVWSIEQPVASKGKQALGWKILDSIGDAKAEEIYDHPAAGVVAKLAHPAVELTLTYKSGKILKIAISAEANGFVYARTSDTSAVYKVSKGILDSLNLKASDLTA